MEENTAIQPANSGLVGRAKAIVMSPKAEWPRVAAETTEPAKVLTSYAIPLIAIGPIASLIGSQLFPISILGITYKPSLTTAIATAVVTFVLAIVNLFLISFVANFLSPKFGGKDSFPAAFRLVAYSMTAAWLAGIFGIVPQLAILSILGLYSFYLFYLGATPVLGVPQDKAAGYTVVTVVVAIIAYFIVAAIAGAITGSFVASNMAAASSGAETATVDMGEFGKVQIDGDTATITVDGQEVEVTVPQE